jgi:3',5'-cyclic AMP phosphodiesterase CpdA
MIPRALTFLLVSALTAFAADPLFFVQASDPQFGFFTNNQDFKQETANWEFAIANVNRLHPAFLVVTGDLTNKAGDADQIAEYKRINRGLDPPIHLYSVPGNHDQTNDPTPETVAAYRKTHGADYYSFQEPGLYGIVLNSTLFKIPGHVAQEEERELRWLEAELPRAQASGAVISIFMHHPLFVTKADEPAGENLPPEIRMRLLSLFHRFGVHYVFAGHLHRNAESKDGDLELIETSASGRPIGDDPSGFRIAEIVGSRIAHKFYGFGLIPNQLPDLTK